MLLRTSCLTAAVWLASCGGTVPADTPADVKPDRELAARWRPEVIQLPPEFAPKLPRGVEELRFAPGMFEAAAEDYWSYVFVLRLEEQVTTQAQLLDLLQKYYVGLTKSVAAGRGLTLEREPARIELKEVGKGRYTAKIDVVDAFVTGKPVLLNMELQTVSGAKGTNVRAAASPKPVDHALWKSLRGVLAALQ